MDVKDQVVIVTGGAHGIGAALCRRFAAEDAAHVAVADLDGAGAQAVADEIGGSAHQVDVGRTDEVEALVAAIEREHGRIDLLCSNAGIAIGGGAEVLDDDWQRIWDINVMAHVAAARAALPGMIERGSGYLLNTASAAGLLSQIGSAPYAVTKHAAVSFAEWLSITHGDDGIGVSVLCPQAVRTAMTANMEEGGVAGVDGMIEPDDVAQCVIEGLADERFWILPHPVVADYARRKADDVDRWLTGMRRLQARYGDSAM
jgi:NAD(P)-dependent dehydrogenase (short-subunit alcohol dehydrogenase family)